jgi:hypothetical protein
MTLSELIGKDVMLMIPSVEPNHYLTVKILGVEAGGIWTQSQDMLNLVYSAVNKADSPRTPVFFIPYCQIRFGITAIPGVALNEKAYGVEPHD